MSNEGKKVKVHYTGTLDNGEKFDSSLDRGEPLEFTCMAGQMIPGFDAAVKEMEVGEKRTVKIACADAYGERDEHKVAHIPFAQLPGAENLEVGRWIAIGTVDGNQLPALVASKDEESVTLDMNHRLAGEDLTFEIELLEVE